METKDYIGTYTRITGQYVGRHSRKWMTGRNKFQRGLDKMMGAVAASMLVLLSE